MTKVRVLVADGETLVRDGVCALLKTHEDIEIVGEATTGDETIRMAREQSPDVVLMNIAMPGVDGTKVIHQVRKEISNIKVLVLTQYEDRDHILIALKAGADGYLLRRATASDLVWAILALYRGDCYLYPSVAKTVVGDYLQHIRQSESPEPYDRLTHREREVLKLIAEGRTSREIADRLGISLKTVLGHRTKVMGKLDIHNRTELIKYAVRKGLITME